MIEDMFYHILSKFGEFHDFANFCPAANKSVPKKVKNKNEFKLSPGMGQNMIWAKQEVMTEKSHQCPRILQSQHILPDGAIWV